MKKYMWYIIIGIAVVALVYFMFIRKKPATANTDTGGKSYSESQIAKVINDIKGTPTWLADVKKKAENAKRTLDEQLRLDAIWQLENA